MVGKRIARTSAAPGKTRLANIYRVVRGSGEPLYLVDLPGYGYARGGRQAAAEFEELTRAFFRRFFSRGIRLQPDFQRDPAQGPIRLKPDATRKPDATGDIAALLLVDSRHPGLQSDIEAWRWLEATIERCAFVATKIDKLARGQRIRAMRELESVFEHPVLPVSAVTGEGLDELWTLIDKLTNDNSSRRKPPHNNNPNRLPRATAGPPARQPHWGPRAAARHRRK